MNDQDQSHKINTHFDELKNANKNFNIKGRNDFLVNPLNNKMRDDVKKTGIAYNLNSDNFRSDEFIKKHKNKHILFAGCSNTFGEGVEYEKTWAYRLYKEISKERLIKVENSHYFFMRKILKECKIKDEESRLTEYYKPGIFKKRIVVIELKEIKY